MIHYTKIGEQLVSLEQPEPEHDDWPRSHKIVVGILGITAWAMLVWLALERLG